MSKQVIPSDLDTATAKPPVSSPPVNSGSIAKGGHQFHLRLHKTEKGWTFDFQLGNLPSWVIALIAMLLVFTIFMFFFGDNFLEHFWKNR